MFRRFLVAVAVTAAALCSISVPAHADTDTDGSHGILSGNQVAIPVVIGISVKDLAAALLGDATVNH